MKAFKNMAPDLQWLIRAHGMVLAHGQLNPDIVDWQERLDQQVKALARWCPEGVQVSDLVEQLSSDIRKAGWMFDLETRHLYSPLEAQNLECAARIQTARSISRFAVQDEERDEYEFYLACGYSRRDAALKAGY